MSSLLRDLRNAAHALSRRPIALATAVLVIGLAIGATSVLFNVLDAALLRPPAHVRNPGEVVRLDPSRRGRASESPWLSFALYELIRDRVTGLSGVAAYSLKSIVIGRDAGAKREVAAELVTPSYFAVLGVSPATGRFFRASEELASPASTVVISYGLWQDAFGGASDVLSKTIYIGNSPFAVVGVAPAAFTGIDKARVDVWLPIAAAAELVDPAALSSPSLYWIRIFGRLGRAPRSVVSNEATAVFRAASGGRTGDDLAIILGSVRPAQDPGGVRSAEARLLISATLSAMMLFLIACANVATVLLVRFLASSRDLATRAALGASRRRLIRDVLLEFAIVAVLGGLFASAVVAASSAIVQAMFVPELDLARSGTDVRTVARTGTLALIAGLFVALPTIVFVWAGYNTRGLNVRARSLFQMATGILVAIQCAVSVVLLIGSGLIGRSLQNVLSLDLGIDTERVLYASADLRADLSRADALALYRTFSERIADIPGVDDVTVAMGLPLHSVWAVAVNVPAGVRTGAKPIVLGHAVGEDYFGITGLRITRGRPFEPWEHTSGANVAVINEAFAREFWPTQKPLGACLQLGSDRGCTRVVGVAVDTPRSSVMLDREYELYVPIREGGFGMKSTLALAIRASADAGADALVVPIRTAVESVSGSVVHAAVIPVATIVAPQLRPWRIGTAVFSSFSIVAVLLVGVGLYGLLAFIVADSQRVIGIRVALGATSSMVWRSIVLRAMGLSGIGTALGLLIGVAVAPAGRSFLFGVEPRDPVVFLGSVVVVLVTTVAASWLPARRATKVDGAALLRST